MFVEDGVPVGEMEVSKVDDVAYAFLYGFAVQVGFSTVYVNGRMLAEEGGPGGGLVPSLKKFFRRVA